MKKKAFMFAAGVSAIFFLALGCNQAIYSKRDPSTTRRACKNELISQNTLVAKLIIALKDSDSDVRNVAAYGLGEIGPAAKDAVPALSVALKDSDRRVRRAATKALKAIQK